MRSNSASDAKMPKTRRPLAVVVSISAPAPADTAGVQLVHGGHQMFQVASQAIQLPDDEGTARLQRLQAGLQTRAVVPATRDTVLVDARLLNAGAEQGAALQVEELAAVCLGNARIAD